MTFDPDWPHGHEAVSKFSESGVALQARVVMVNESWESPVLVEVTNADGALFVIAMPLDGNGLYYKVTNKPAPPPTMVALEAKLDYFTFPGYRCLIPVRTIVQLMSDGTILVSAKQVKSNDDQTPT